MRNKFARVPDPNKFVSNPGTEFEIRYKSIVNDDGTITLEEEGKINIKEYINSFAESTDMAYIMKRLQLGDISVLEQSKGVFGDFTEMPTTMMEAQQRILDGQAAFMQLPIDVRNAYDHNVWLWMNDAGSEKWMNVMKDLLPQKENVVESEVTADA